MVILEKNDFIISNNTILSYVGKDKMVFVPAVIDGIKIRRVGEGAFFNNRNIIYLRLGEGISEIGERAFEGCDHLHDLRLPASLNSISSNAFSGAKRLTNINFYARVSYPEFENIKEGMIALARGGAIVDPMLLGTDTLNYIRKFQNGNLISRVPEPGTLGFIYANQGKGGLNNGGIKWTYVIKEYADRYRLGEKTVQNEESAFTNRIENGCAEISFEHNEEGEDRFFAMSQEYEPDNMSLVFFQEEGSVDDSGITLHLMLRYAVYYCYSGVKINIHSKEYYYRNRYYFNSDVSIPFVRVKSDPCIFDENGPLPPNSEIGELAESMYGALCGLI